MTDMDGMTFAEVRSLANNGYPSWLTEGEARWIDAMPERPLMSEVAHLPEVIFRPLFSDVLTYGPDCSCVKAFRDLFKLEVNHPHLKAVETLLEAITVLRLIPEEKKRTVMQYREIFTETDAELYERVTLCSDSVTYKTSRYNSFYMWVIRPYKIDQFHIVFVLHGFRSNHKIREWLGKNPEVQGALNAFSQTVYGEDW